MFNRISTITRKRVAAALLVLLVVPSVWMRTGVTRGAADDLRLVELPYSEAEDGELQVTGAWEVTSQDLIFGGYSALLVDRNGMMVTFSDRGRFLSFAGPDGPSLPAAIGPQLPDPGMEQRLWDIEAVTQDPVSGTFWLGFEGEHAIQRYTARGAPDGHVLLPGMGWRSNGGMESLARLDDGRFIALPESEARLHVFAEDPVRQGETTSVAIEWPAAGYFPTDAVQLPDGRLLVLMRRVVWGLPPTFDTILVAGALPEGEGPWQPELALALHDLVPRDNYEGMDLVERADGGADIWLISDDNFSAFQRTLLVRLELAPPESDPDPDADSAHEKAREDRSARAFSRMLVN